MRTGKRTPASQEAPFHQRCSKSPLKLERYYTRQPGLERRGGTDRCQPSGRPGLPISVFQTDHFPYFCRSRRDIHAAIPGIKKTSLWIIAGNSSIESRCIMAWRLRIGRDRKWLPRQYGIVQRITYYDGPDDSLPGKNCSPVVCQPCRDLSLWSCCARLLTEHGVPCGILRAVWVGRVELVVGPVVHSSRRGASAVRRDAERVEPERRHHSVHGIGRRRAVARVTSTPAVPR